MLSDRYRRIILGVATLFMAAIAFWLNVLDPALGEQYPQFAAGSVRMTPVLAVIWLAMPDVMRGPQALLFIVAVVCAVALMFKSGKTGLKFIVPAIGVLLFIGWLRRFTAILGGRPPTRR